MKVKVPLVLLLLLAAAVGYLLGTEKGRGQRDEVLAKIRERKAGDALVETAEEAAADVVDVTERVAEAAAEGAESAAITSS